MELHLFEPKNTLGQFTHTISLEVSNIPQDADLSSFDVSANGSEFRLFCLNVTSRTSLYQFGFNDFSYELGHNCNPEVEIQGVPKNANLKTINVLYDSGTKTWRLYFQDKDDSQLLYQFKLIDGKFDFLREIRITGLEGTIDHLPTSMLFANGNYHFFALDKSKNLVYQAVYSNDTDKYEASNNLSYSDSNIDISRQSFSMTYGEDEYMQYFIAPSEHKT